MIYFSVFVLVLIISLFFLPKYKGERTGFFPLVLFFLILYMAGIASQLWIVPFGPVFWGVSWIPLLFILIIFTFLLAVPSPYQARRKRKITRLQEEEAEEEFAEGISIFTWLLLFLLLIVTIIGLYKASTV